MKILVHDYSGHAFTVQLSRRLAASGHDVLHLYSASFQAPRGPLTPMPDDPPGFAIRGLDLGQSFAKYSFVKRAVQERAYGKLLAGAIAEYAPAVALSVNTPLDPQAAALAACRRHGIGFVFWVQDLYGHAIDRILRRKMPIIGAAIGARYMALERRLWRSSDAVVAITGDFVPILESAGVEPARLSVVENWAPREDLARVPRDNPWAAEHGLVGALVFLYAGTLGLKHNPELLLKLAERYRSRPEVKVVVVSEGLGADWLAHRSRGLANFKLLPFQPFARLSEVIAAGDVLVAVLEAEAGIYSVPSKVLTYLCAGRPLLAAIPPDNRAARIIAGNRAGLVAASGDEAGFLAAADRLAQDPALRAELGNNALDYAAKTFDIDAVVAGFLAIIERAAAA
ncbi:MAG: glycosyltransferase family 4 protein [Pseudomonadota bacterium]